MKSYKNQIKATENFYSVVLYANLAVQGAAKFQVCGWNPKVWSFKLN